MYSYLRSKNWDEDTGFSNHPLFNAALFMWASLELKINTILSSVNPCHFKKVRITSREKASWFLPYEKLYYLVFSLFSLVSSCFIVSFFWFNSTLWSFTLLVDNDLFKMLPLSLITLLLLTSTKDFLLPSSSFYLFTFLFSTDMYLRF